MTANQSMSRSLLALATLCAPAANAAVYNNAIEVDLDQASRQYCHIVRFPGGWKYGSRQPDVFRSEQTELEFHVEGSLGTRFLAGAYAEIGARINATNAFRVNLSDATAKVEQASYDEWQRATVVALTRNSLFRRVPQPEPATPARLNGFEFTKTGAAWALGENATRLSPDSAWLVLQSATATRQVLIKPSAADLFWDVFNVDAGKKLLTVR